MLSKVVAFIVGINRKKPTEDELYVMKALRRFPSLRVVRGCRRNYFFMDKKDEEKAYLENLKKIQRALEKQN